MRRLALLAATAAVLLVTGCSQIAAIAPVGGDRLAEVRFAAGDVLVAQGVDILEAPVCSAATDDTVTCEGSTLDGERIFVTAPGAEGTTFSVQVGAETIFEGEIQAVLDSAVEPAS